MRRELRADQLVRLKEKNIRLFSLSLFPGEEKALALLVPVAGSFAYQPTGNAEACPLHPIRTWIFAINSLL